MPGRNANPGQYRHGYQGSEKDDEITGSTGSNYTTFYRAYDSRVIRWWTMDPITQPWQSPYTSMDGNPIYFNDPLGNRIIKGGSQERKDIRWAKRNVEGFREKYRQMRHDAHGKILYIKRADYASSTLNDAEVSSESQDPAKEGKSGNKNFDYFEYSAIEGADQGGYSIVQVSFKDFQTIHPPIIPASSTSGYIQNYTTSMQVSSNLPSEIFSNWVSANISSNHRDGAVGEFSGSLSFASSSSSNSILLGNVTPIPLLSPVTNPIMLNRMSKPLLSNQGPYINIEAMSVPIILKVNRNSFGRLMWHELDRYPVDQHQEGEIPRIFPNMDWSRKMKLN